MEMEMGIVKNEEKCINKRTHQMMVMVMAMLLLMMMMIIIIGYYAQKFSGCAFSFNFHLCETHGVAIYPHCEN